MGLGFGGEFGGYFRIWIDEQDMVNDSYVTTED